MRYFLQLSYLGKAYNGWQIQPNAPSVQQTLQQSLGTLLRRPVETVGAGAPTREWHRLFLRRPFRHGSTDRRSGRFLLPPECAVAVRHRRATTAAGAERRTRPVRRIGTGVQILHFTA